MLGKTERKGETGMGETHEREGSFSRREFLKIAGVAGATVGAGAGLGGLLAACGEETTTTTTAAATTTTTAAATTTTAAPSTTVSTEPEAGREVKVGVIIPFTGYLALFGASDKWSLGLVQKYIGDSMVMGDGKKHKLTWVTADTQSDSNRAAQVTSDLVLNDKVDLAVVAGSPDTVNPAADMAETMKLPLLCCNNIWEAFIFGRGADMTTEFKYVWGHFLGVDQCVRASVQLCDKMTTNKVVSVLESNTADGQAWLVPNTGIIDAFTAAGYTPVYPGPYNKGTEDYTSFVSAFKKAGCEIHMGSNPGTDFPNYWKQAIQQNYNPKMAIEIVSISTYEDMKALGDIVIGLTLGFTWHKDWPYSDFISGMTNAELAADYEAANGTMWNNMIGPYARIQWAVDVLKRVKDIDSEDSILETIKTTKTDLTIGPLDFTSPVDPAGLHVTPNVYKQTLCLGQVVKGTGKWDYDVPLVAAIDAPATVKTIDPVAIQYQ